MRVATETAMQEMINKEHKNTLQLLCFKKERKKMCKPVKKKISNTEINRVVYAMSFGEAWKLKAMRNKNYAKFYQTLEKMLDREKIDVTVENMRYFNWKICNKLGKLW